MELHRYLILTLLSISFSSSLAQDAEPTDLTETQEAPEIPFDLLADEHIREEFGINEFTTPSIRKLFESLDGLGTLPYDDLKRDISDRTPSERTLLSLNLGILIADGFLVVHSEKVDELELVGGAILDYAQVLGSRSSVARHAKSLLEGSLLGDWESLKEELAKTQADVEAEMILLRDAEVAQLISLGGWIRAFQIATFTADKNYTTERAADIARGDIAAYYLHLLDDMHPDLKELPHLAALRTGIGKISETLDIPEGRALTEEEVAALKEIAAELLTAVAYAPKD
jgi:hypothetical protein